MRGALIRELGAAPEIADVGSADGAAVVAMVAVALNPLDVNIANGRFYGGHPELPYVPGCEGVGRVGGGLVYVFGGGLGVSRDGVLTERVAVPEGASFELPGAAEPGVAAACGIAGVAAWAPVTRVAQVREGDRVLVLGATGTVGQIALQAARLRGAERVVAAGRDRERLERARELGADAVVELDGEALGSRFKEACGGDGPTVVIDPLWGAPVTAATEAAAPGARIVQIGQSAGPEATLTSANVRGKQLRILGHSNFGMSAAERREMHLELLGEVQAGRIVLDLERFPLERVGEAWQAQARGAKAIVDLA
jgi:NADPH:quinone reductase-like Zn-dependent oxidoreductase